MKTFYKLLSICFLIIGSVTVSYGQNDGGCSGQFTITYPSSAAGGFTTTTVNNGTAPFSTSYCPTGGSNTTTISVVPANAGTLTLRTGSFTGPVVQQYVNTVPNQTYTFTVAVSSQTTYYLNSVIACNNAKSKDLSFTLQPSLSLAATQNGSSVVGTVCPNTTVRLTAVASGTPAPSNYQFYTLSASGVETVLYSGANNFYDATPTTSTSYYVRANQTSCGSNTVQTINVATNQISVSSSATGAVCPNVPVTLSANNLVANSSYTLENSAGTTVATATSTAGGTVSFTVTPATTTTYTIKGAIPSCSSGPAQGSVTVSTNQLTLSSTSTNITKGTQVTLTAGAGTGTYTWTSSIDGVNYTPVTPISSTANSITVAPARTTQYKVSGTTATGNCSDSRTILITVNGVILPVEFASFTAIWAGKAPLLNWATASEKSSASFVVERSLDGLTFVAIGQRAGAGSTMSRTEYQFVDAGLPSFATGTVYYRLRQVNTDGTFAYSSVATLQVRTNKASFKASAFPNPFEKNVAVEVESLGAGPIVFTVYDVLGKKLLTRTVTAPGIGMQKVSLPEAATLRGGVYYLTIRQGAQQQVLKLSRK